MGCDFAVGMRDLQTNVVFQKFCQPVQAAADCGQQDENSGNLVALRDWRLYCINLASETRGAGEHLWFPWKLEIFILS